MSENINDTDIDQTSRRYLWFNGLPPIHLSLSHVISTSSVSKSHKPIELDEKNDDFFGIIPFTPARLNSASLIYVLKDSSPKNMIWYTMENDVMSHVKNVIIDIINIAGLKERI